MRLLIVGLGLLLVAGNVFAGEGHSHGDEAFAGATASSSFVLSKEQIANLDLQNEVIVEQEFYNIINLPAVVKKQSLDESNPVIQGFLSEGREILQIKKGQKADLKLDAWPDKIFSGEVYALSSMLDPQTRLYSVWVKVANLPQNLLGFKGEVSIRTSFAENALAVPLAALQGDFGDYFVFVQDGEHFSRKKVLIGHQNLQYVEIIAGVENGQKVVTQGSHQLQYVTGTPVEEEEKTPETKTEHSDDDHEHGHEDEHDHQGEHEHQAGEE